MPRGGECSHRRCFGGECRMLSDEELTPSAADEELGKRLVAEGWRSISTNYRRVARWVRIAPPLRDIVDPAWLDHPAVQAAAKTLDYERRWGLRTPTKSPDIETRVLTVREWRAFKAAGGQVC